MVFANLDGLLIRNNCRWDSFPDPLQVKLIDAIICEYKKGIDEDSAFLKGLNIIVYIDSRDEDDYPAHIRSSWTRRSNPHLASSRIFFKGCDWAKVVSVHCRNEKRAEYDGGLIDNYIEKALAKIFPWCES